MNIKFFGFSNGFDAPPDFPNFAITYRRNISLINQIENIFIRVRAKFEMVRRGETTRCVYDKVIRVAFQTRVNWGSASRGLARRWVNLESLLLLVIIVKPVNRIPPECGASIHVLDSRILRR